jgi:hypothetical protein
LGINENDIQDFYSVEKITHSLGESIYKITLEDDTILECSESHCIFVDEFKSFVYAYGLSTGYSVKTINGLVKIKTIEIQKARPVVGIKLFNNGCYFANDILSHSQDVLPNFIVHVIKQIKNPKEQQVIFRAQATKTISVSCVALGTQILLSDKTNKLVDNININDLVLGFDSYHNEITNKVIDKKISFNAVYRINFEDSFVECSNTHLLFSFTEHDYRFIWQLRIGDYLLFNDCIKEILSIEKIGDGVVVALNFETPGNFFANGVLGHSENTPIKTEKFNKQIRALITDSAKSVLSV